MLWVVSVFAGFLGFGDLTCLGLPGSGTVEMCTSPCNLGKCPARSSRPLLDVTSARPTAARPLLIVKYQCPTYLWRALLPIKSGRAGEALSNF